MARKTSKQPTQVESLKHQNKRANIPTEELRDFVAEEEQKPKTVLYPRDPSLDPQLVWKGKDEQDQQDLAVPAVPVYIQEKIHPQAIIDEVTRASQLVKKHGQDTHATQFNLFSDFNGIEFEDLIDFYRHEQNWSNRMILGDSLLVMTSLAEKEGLKGKVQMIYIDPPYGIKFGSNWQVSTRKRDVKDGKAEDATRQPEQVKAFRDTWQLGIHSYLAYLRDRLTVARELLTESGSVFVQIGDENVHLVRCLMDEVFGSENFVSLITTKKSGGMGQQFMDNVSDFILWYAKDNSQAKYRQLYTEKVLSEGAGARYNQVELADGTVRPITKEESLRPQLLPEDSRVFLGSPLTSETPSASTVFGFELEGRKLSPTKGGWKTNREGMNRLIRASKLFNTKGFVNYRMYFADFPAVAISNLWEDTMGTAEQNKVYVVQTTTKVVERCLLMTTDPGDLVLDPTCGSGTTAYVAEQWGRRWITCDTSRVALALARTRIMSAKFPYYLLADSPEGARKEAGLTGSLTPALSQKERGSGEADIKKGFVYKRVPHVTLKSIANNAEIDAIHAKWQEKLEPLRAELNKLLGTNWEEWEVPRELPDNLCSVAPRGRQNKHPQGVTLLEEWWKLRRGRQKEIDASIARRADTEILYDQPYEDNKKVRVTGPFTVESLSPHRTISVEEKIKRREVGMEGWKIRQLGPSQFATTIIENLRKAGVQNTVKGERLKFDSLDPFAGEWIHAAGQYTESGSDVSSEKTTAGIPSEKDTGRMPVPRRTRRVAICIGPEHGTVGAQLVKEAAKEAVKGVGFYMLIVCGFAFDPSVSEEIKRYGKLTVLPTKMNPDLAMGDELLKKTGAGNLFMVFGEPDVEVRHAQTPTPTPTLPRPQGRATEVSSLLEVEVKGVDVYDPTTGEIRSSATDDIACWFIDTNYNGESFFVRHAYFTGADEPYDKLKRALRAEIDEAAWQTLYTTVSQPFAPPETGKIAVKVINHYGDEVMKVFEVETIEEGT